MKKIINNFSTTKVLLINLKLTVRLALNSELDEEIERDSRVLI
jgi:hypothetical protein